ncbi:hypothetical protein OAR94_03160, partial [Candidatus Pelagibacter sp.]|nr:hypothetical protein [Candidatus Pelagibacter sp.]
MKNKLKNFVFIFFCFFLLCKSVNSNEAFVFNVTEIEILENGNQINGYKGGTATSKDGSVITADKFFFNKLTNILEVTGNVKYLDISNDIIITSDKAIYLKDEEKVFTTGNSKAVNENNTITASSLEYDKINNIFKAKKNAVAEDFEKETTIYADEITYLKNDEKVFTKGKTKALIENKYQFNSEDVSYYRNLGNLISQKESSIEDNNGNIYKVKSFNYNIDKELLKGKKVQVLAKVDGNKIDKYFFSEGFFNFKDKSHLAKETKIKTHKDVFGDTNQDPRIYGSSSFSDQNKTVVNNGIFTSCKLNDNCPPWSIKAEKITHDKINKDMIYKNAVLKIYDFPILYFPKFFHPDPSVKRRSGFLQPQFNNSKTLGSSLHVPYFKTLGHDKDLTIKPTFFEKLTSFEKDKYILQSEFRKKSKDSFVIADLGFLRDYKPLKDNKTKNVNHLFLDYTKDLNDQDYTDSKIEVQIEKVTNDTYLKVFQNNLQDTNVLPDSQTTMNSNIKLYIDKIDQNFTTGIDVYEKLGIKHSDRYQYVLPYYDLSKNLTNILEANTLEGSLNFYSSGSNTLSNTNNLQTKVVNDLNYSSKNFISNLGFKNNYSLYIKNLNLVGKNDPTYSSSAQIDGMGIFKVDTVFPLMRSDKISKQTLTPKISFRINPENKMDDFSQTSSIIDTNNVFDINRLGISNDFETGKSLTLGLEYKFDKLEKDNFKNQKDKYIEFKLATVVRDQNEKNISKKSTLNRKNSNLFGSINSELFENISLTYDFSLDNDLETLNSNSISSEISLNNFVTSFKFIEQSDEIGTSHILSNTTEYRYDDYNSFKFSTRRNKEISLTEYYDLSYEYKNDCLTAALKFNKTFYSDKDLTPTEDLFVSI